MPTKVRVLKNDLVLVVAGRDIGKKGRVLTVKPRDRKLIVEGVNIIHRHTRRNPQAGNVGGIVDREAMIDISNVKVVCPSCSVPTRIGIKTLEDGVRKRQCKKCSAIIEQN